VEALEELAAFKIPKGDVITALGMYAGNAAT